MHIHSKIYALFILILAACVPHHTGAAPDMPPAETKSEKSAEVGSYLLYLQARQDQDFDAAVRYLKEALNADPGNRALQSEMFALLTVEGRIDDAYPYALTELKAAPDSLLASLVVIAYHVSKNDFAAAQKQIDSFPAKEENAFLYPLLEVWIQAGLDDRKKALKALEKLNQEGLESLYYFHSALLYDLWNDEEKAEKNYETLLREPGGLSLRAAQAYGNFLLRQGETKKFNALVEAYRKGAKSYPLLDETFFTAGAVQANKKVPKSIATPKAGLAEAFFDISGSLADKGSPEISLFFIRFSLVLDPSLSLARVLLGEIYEKQERYDEALKLYAEEKENSETYYASQIRMGIIFARQKDLPRAEKQLRKMAAKRQELAFPWVELGDIFITEKKFPQAIEAFSEAINRIPVPNRAHWVLFYSRGAAYERNKQWELAEQDLLQALVLSPDQPLTLNYLGYSWIERGKNIAKAKEMLERAALLSPREGFIADSLGWAYYLLKDYPKSDVVLENAVALDPGSAVINDHLGDVYWRVGRKREARFQWAKALGLKDDFPDNDRKRVELKLEKGLDSVGDKVVLPDRNTSKGKKSGKSK
ncbi:MAG: hypothetical protein ACI4TE_03990 [Alphaproteobacteria bacterium]